MRRILCGAIALLLALLPAQADFGAGNALGGFWSARRLSDIQFFNSATSALSTVVMPASVIRGDVAVLFDIGAGFGETPVDVVPSNFTGLSTATSAGFAGPSGICCGRTRISYKILDGTEGGATITGMNPTTLPSGGGARKVILVFRTSNMPVLSVSNEDWTSVLSAGNNAAQSPSPAAGALSVVFGMAGIFLGTTAFSTASPAFDGTVTTADSDLSAGYTIYDGTPSGHTIDMNDLGGNNYLSSGVLTFQ
jgi:hypothetical protein